MASKSWTSRRMSRELELPKEVMGEPMEETPNGPGTSSRRHQRQHHHPRSTKRPRCSRSSSACDWHTGTSHLQECEGNSQNPSCVQELPLHLLLEKRQHVHLSYKKLVSAWSEERDRESEKERERERREHFRFRGSGELIKLPFRSGPRRELNRKFFWPGGYYIFLNDCKLFISETGSNRILLWVKPFTSFSLISRQRIFSTL